jgi:flotillin
MFFWHVPAPNEALLISGSKRQNQGTQFRIVTGHGCFVIPVKQKARLLSLALREAVIVAEMEKLGIVVDALQIQEIEDASGYISNLAAPHAATVASQARIAKAHADQEAAERELAAAAMKAQFERDTAIKRAGFLAETDQAQAVAAQAAPLAQAQTAQQVIQQQTALAQRQAELAAQRLEAEVRRPADAEAYRTRTLAEAERDQVRFAAEAEAYRTRALAEAQAEAIRVRADSLREGNSELIAANRLIEILPSLVEAAARGLADSNLTVLNGTQGVNEVVAGLVGQGLSILDTLKKSTAVTGHGVTGNGVARPAHAAPVPVAAGQDGRLGTDAT